MKFGIQHPNFSFDGEGTEIVESLRRLATQAENSGFDSFWVMDHFHQIGNVGEPREPMLESWTTLSTIAGFTSRIRLGTMVTGIVYRYPSVLAKIGATLDVLSRGRLFMGIGAAWNEEEAAAYGIPFPSTSERFQRLEEAVQIIRKMWTEQPASFAGKFYQVRDAHCNPQPIQKPHPPILIGGSGERKTLRIVAQYGDACNLFGSSETVKKKLAVLREHCRDVGRDYNSILKTKLGTVTIDKDRDAARKRVEERFKGAPEQRMKEFVIYGNPEDVRRQVEAFRDVGIEYFILSFEPQRELEAMNLFANEVVRRF
ncbi:MAG: LLM class F420-dependent oxidoreductase [Candidatus Bathyarchaeia archaeon]|jgi:F420-dependent oxidoreductase-like protein